MADNVRLVTVDPSSGTETPTGTPTSPLTVTVAGNAPSAAGSYQKITGLNTVKQLTVPSDATYAIVFVSDQGVRVRLDGTSPASSTGLPWAAGDRVKLSGAEMAAARFIEQAASAVLDVYYGR